MQHLAQRIVFPEGPSSVRVVIDADGYRERRAESLRADAFQVQLVMQSVCARM